MSLLSASDRRIGGFLSGLRLRVVLRSALAASALPQTRARLRLRLLGSAVMSRRFSVRPVGCSCASFLMPALAATTALWICIVGDETSPSTTHQALNASNS